MTFSLLTLNLRHGQGPRISAADPNWSLGVERGAIKTHAAAIGSFIRQMAPKPDIVCLQETNASAFFWPDVTEIIRESAGYSHIATASAVFLPHNNAIVSRLPLRRVVSHQFRKRSAVAAGWRGMCYSMNRGFIAVDIEEIGTVASTHLDPFVPALRLRQARELRQALPARNLIIAGDFNPEVWDAESLRVMGEGLTAIPSVDQGYFTSFATWPAGRLERASPKAGRLERASLGAGALSSEIVPKRRLDYGFVSPEFRIVSAERILTGHTDHYGVAIIVERHAPR